MAYVAHQTEHVHCIVTWLQRMMPARFVVELLIVMFVHRVDERNPQLDLLMVSNHIV